MNPLRIGLVTERFPPDPGGLARSVGRLAHGLAARGLEVHVFTLSSDSSPGTSARSAADGVTVHALGPHRKVEDTLAVWIAHLETAHRAEPLDLLHAYYVTRPAFVAAHVANLVGIPSVVSARGNDLDRTVLDPSKAAHTLFALQAAGAVTANSADLARKASSLGLRADVEIIPNGVDVERLRRLEPDRALARRLGVEGRPVVGFVGEARAKKGLATLLLAFERVVEATGGAPVLLLVGGVRQEDRETLDVFRARAPEADVVVVEHVDPDELGPYYALIDVLTMPSLRDGLPNALLEGMACERAIVASEAGGMPDVIEHGVNGHLVAAGSVDELADAVLALLGDPATRARYGQAARRTVVERHRPELEVERTLSLYRRLLSGTETSSSSR